MARKWNLFQFKLSVLIKNVLLGFCCILLILLSQISSAPGIDKKQQAQQLTQLGFSQLYQGQAREAIKTWEAAYTIYKRLKNSEGMSGTLINQSLALQALGLYPRSCEVLIQSLKLDYSICDSLNQRKSTIDAQIQKLNQGLQQPISEVHLIGLQNLGNVLRLIGNLEISEHILKKSLEISDSQNLIQSRVHEQLLLALANTERNLYSRAKNRYEITDEPIAKHDALKLAQLRLKAALEIYQNLSKKHNSATLQAQLNQLSLFLEQRKWALLDDRTINIQFLVKELVASDFGQLSAIESIYARLNFVQSLIQISQENKLNQIFISDNLDILDIALKLTEESLQLSQRLNNQRAKSYALGISSNIYSILGRSIKQKELLTRALALAQSVRAWDIAYQWQQQLGQLYQQSGDLDKAVQAYAAAVNSLDIVRNNLLSINTDIQFSFKEKVEPVYQEYIQLLLLKKADLKQVIQVKEKLQLAELENYLKCQQIPVVPLNKDLSSTSSIPKIYLFNLGNNVEVITETLNGVIRHTIDSARVNTLTENLISILQDQQFLYIKEQEFLFFSQSLYDLLIAPIKNNLPASGTLILILDSYFQNIPFALLNDGQKYLVESYSLSFTSIYSIGEQPLASNFKKLKALIAGISQNPNLKTLDIQNFNPLPEVEIEIQNIAKHIPSKKLLNNEFTSEHFREQMQKNFPVVHITTHGQFSSDPEQTFVLAWDKIINVRDFNSLLHNRKSIELLVLSACQTAKGDRRSALGIAGVAIQAGARSTLASLWKVDAQATALLMGEFYKQLKNHSKAEALQQAQLTLLSNPKYKHPFYWAAFILVGSHL